MPWTVTLLLRWEDQLVILFIAFTMLCALCASLWFHISYSFSSTLIISKDLIWLCVELSGLTLEWEPDVENRVAPISGIKGSDSEGGPAPRRSIIYTESFSSLHFSEAFCWDTDRKVNFCKVHRDYAIGHWGANAIVHWGARVQVLHEDCIK